MNDIDKFFEGLIDKISYFHENMIKTIKGVFITPEDLNFLRIVQKE